MPEQKQTKGAAAPVSFRPSKLTRQQLDELMDAIGENQSDVIARAIERLWIMETFQDRENLCSREVGR